MTIYKNLKEKRKSKNKTRQKNKKSLLYHFKRFEFKNLREKTELTINNWCHNRSSTMLHNTAVLLIFEQ